MSNLDIIALTCPACGKQVEVNSEMAAQQVLCPHNACGAAIDVPAPDQSELGLNAQLMYAAGLLFAVIAAYLSIKEANLEWGWIVSLLLVALVAASEFLKGFVKGGTLVLFALAGLSTPVFFFLLRNERGADLSERNLAFYLATGVFFGLSSYLVLRTRRTWSQFDLKNSAKRALNLDSVAVWFALTAASLAFSWSTYYSFLATLGQEEIWRRLVFTLFFIVVGVTCSVFGKNSQLPFPRVMGLTFMVAGVAKALAYDMTHLTGVLRIAVFASSGAVLLLGGFLMQKPPPPIGGAEKEIGRK